MYSVEVAGANTEQRQVAIERTSGAWHHRYKFYLWRHHRSWKRIGWTWLRGVVCVVARRLPGYCGRQTEVRVAQTPMRYDTQAPTDATADRTRPLTSAERSLNWSATHQRISRRETRQYRRRRNDGSLRTFRSMQLMLSETKQIFLTYNKHINKRIFCFHEPVSCSWTVQGKSQETYLFVIRSPSELWAFRRLHSLQAPTWSHDLLLPPVRCCKKVKVS